MASQDRRATIVRSKLNRPRLSPRHVPRARLVDRLELRRDRRLTLVCAPAGSGKSTLLSEWASASERRAAWVSLDEHDADPCVFASYLLAAVGSLFPGVAFETTDLVRAPGPVPPEALAASLANDLDQIADDYLLLLDDYHLVAGPEIDALLTSLLRHPPGGLHLAVASREEPAWPLAAHRAKGDLQEIRFDDLRLTDEESARFLRASLPEVADDELVAAIQTEADGWAAGVQLLAMAFEGASRDHAALLAGLGQHDSVHDYLLAEVLGRLPTADQERLLRLAVVRRFDAALCEELCRGTAVGDAPGWGERFLLDLRERNPFVVGLDPQQRVFAFHHLMRRFLLRRLEQLHGEGAVHDLSRRASAWLAARGAVDEAFDLALAAGDAAMAGALVADHRLDLYHLEDFGRLAQWLGRLPAEVRVSNPELLLAAARIATVNCQYPEAVALLDRADDLMATARLSPEDAAVAVGEWLTLRGVLDFWRGDGEALMRHALRARELLPERCTHLRGMLHIGIASAHLLLGRPDDAAAYLEAHLARTPPDASAYASLLQMQCHLAWLDGRLTELEATARRLLAVTDDLALPDQHALAEHFLGCVRWSRNDLPAARDHFAAAVDARFTMRLNWWCHACGGLALTLDALGRPDEAAQVLAEARAFLLDRQAVGLSPLVAAYEAELARLRGRDDTAAEATVDRATAARTVLALGIVDPPLVRARALVLDGGDAPAADDAMDILRACRDRLKSRRLGREAEALDLLAAYRRGEHDRALDRLDGLVVDAAAERDVRLFVDLGEPMAQLLRRLAARPHTARGVTRLVAAFAPAGRDAADLQAGLPEPLSDRELEVLAALAGHKSNKEIADDLYIAPSTVKRHTLNIYRKLDVGDRRSAVRRADQLGLLAAVLATGVRDPS